MVTLNIAEKKRKLTDLSEIRVYLQNIGIAYEQWQPSYPLTGNSTADEILKAYASDLEILKQAGGYIKADVIDINPDTPNLEAMLAKFHQEHWHDEDEIRFIIEGHGLFHINPQTSPVVAIEVSAGDLLVVPKGTLHWFDLCSDRRIRAIRLFQDISGWTPHYTHSNEENKYIPLCFSSQFLKN
ncbi:1,2-dihydroxy-3-keto-5-methylthiopentene dioxygenase [Nostoc sp. UHCC 0251]|uniref:1,2-dihydroxy-3-keto-5-methylthiopentene dioxygenase n=1 Tax=Nostoc sp. UHCC 0251 TaxID=3110240 RepID=UPI002B210B3F|nr:cupin domain-containing protein [Nostoc sp. UHCC 0251]MEA5621828.1 cupin domain-containing protein [Nostoc sp. UHCC 0251]